MSGSSMQPIAYFWGGDAFAIDRATASFAADLGGTDGPLTMWRASGDEEEGTETGAGAKRTARLLGDIEQRIAVAPMFGGGTLVVIRQPGALLRERTARERLLGLVVQVPPGNGLCINDLVASGSKGPAAAGVLRDAIAAAGGVVREFPVPTRERMEAWIGARATELGVRLAPGAARLLTDRIGASVREGDVDRRRHSELANSELEKLALLRPDGVITPDDVRELVPEHVPGSMWAFLDAVAVRRSGDAARLAEQLVADGVALPIVVSQLHRRIRELIGVREHLSSGTRPGDLVRILRVQPFRAQKLAEQASTWTAADLEAALDGLLELDLASKGIAPDGSPAGMSEARSTLALQAWIAETGRRSR